MVSHCYRRPTYDDWPYSIFTMVHGKNAKECETTIAAVHAETGIDEYALLWSVKEYKKTRVRYFTDDWREWSDRHILGASSTATPARHCRRASMSVPSIFDHNLARRGTCFPCTGTGRSTRGGDVAQPVTANRVEHPEHG